MREDKSEKHYDLEDRTFQFAKAVRRLVKGLKMTIGNQEDGRQVIRASGSVGANYIEANEALSKKDFIMRIKICRKEAKESRFFLNLLDTDDDHEAAACCAKLAEEARELTCIFGAILTKTSNQS